MREILFRGKCNEVGKYNGQWIEGFYGEDDGKPIIARSTDHGLIGYFCEPDSIGQYTGLTDKNGKKIFEGDILAAPDYPNLKYKVSFANANFCVKCPAQPYLFYLGSRCFDMFGNPEYEIVGNVYDSDKEPFGNPEQLGGESDG